MHEIYDHIYRLNVQVLHYVENGKIYEIEHDQDDHQDSHERILYAGKQFLIHCKIFNILNSFKLS